MSAQQRYFFKKSEKLKSRKLIGMLFEKGKSFSVFPFKVFYLNNTIGDGLQTGVGVSSRNFKKAVDRNRIKRLMREAYRLQKNELQNKITAKQQSLGVFILYIGKELPEYPLVLEKIKSVIQKLNYNTNEISSKNT